MAKILLVSRCAWTLYNFRKELIQELQRQGETVIGAGAGGDGFEAQIEALGTTFVPLPVDRKAVNPLMDLRLLWALFRWYRREQPDIVHHFTIKPVIYGSLAARLAGVPRIVNTIPGLGYAFTDEAPHWIRPLVERLYRLSLSHSDFTFFQNSDDRQLFIDRKLIRPEQTGIAPEWVDTDRFAPRKAHTASERPVTLLMIARMLKEKGVYEFVEAACRIRSENPNVRFLLLGGRDERNPRVVPLCDLERWQAEGNIEWLGAVSDVRDVLAGADIVVLPSYYREGSPRALMEAAAMGKPIITTDNVGCREVVADGVNGLLIPVRDVAALVGAMQCMISHPMLRHRMGTAGRERMLREFDQKVVVANITKVYAKPTQSDPHD